jgi:DNA-binding beta-propeller fold protein YncE
MLKGTAMSSKKGNVLWPFLAVLFFLLAFQGSAWAEEIYRYKRMWPMLQQPWYFQEPSTVAVSPAGHVYVVDKENHRIQKYTLDGQFLLKWGSEGEADGQFQYPQGIAVGPDGSVYVTDNTSMNVQKFTADGQFIAKWPKANDLHFPEGIAVDSLGNVYIVTSGDCFIHKFSSNGQFIKKWGGEGNGVGKFIWPMGITTDVTGHLYITDIFNISIQKFTLDGEFIDGWNGDLVSPSGVAAGKEGNIYVTTNYNIHMFSPDGKFIRKWGDPGGKDGEFWSACGVAVDPSGNVYVTDGASNGATNRVQKFTPDGDFIAKWGSYGNGKGQFWTPLAVAVDAQRNVYVLDKENYRIQKFSALGQFVTQWGSYGTGNGQFIWPAFIAVDTKGNVYVAGDNSIQKFTPSGQFLVRWGKQGDYEGLFHHIDGIAINGNDQVYVTDEYEEIVQKFDSEGQLLTKWGTPETAEHGIWWPNGIAIDAGGKVYVADNWNMGIQMFDADGLSLGFWGEWGDGNGEFRRISGVAVDALGYVFVGDSDNHRIQKFTSDGQLISQIGQFGSNPGQLNGPLGVAVDTHGSVYVADTNNNRMMVFEPVSQPPWTKAIVLAGGGPYPGNSLWDATQMVSNLAFRSLHYQGFAKEQIRYLTSNTKQDLDDNGKFDDLYDATKDNLRTFITDWAKDAEKLLIYLTDHGNQGTFRINAGEGEAGMLTAGELSEWLDELPGTEVVVIIDACYAGSFVGAEGLSKPGRIIITSTGPTEKALFGLSGSLSFSNYFWAQVFNGANLHKAFTTARQAVRFLGNQSVNPQTPQVDANGNGNANEAQEDALLANLELLNQARSYNKAPVVKSYSASPNPIPEGNNTATLRADGVTDADGIQRV